METANATRPKFGERATVDEIKAWITLGISFDGEPIKIEHIERIARLMACHNALAGIRNPSAIPALIEAARPIAATADTHFDDYPVGREIIALAQALAALDAEPVA